MFLVMDVLADMVFENVKKLFSIEMFAGWNTYFHISTLIEIVMFKKKVVPIYSDFYAIS